MDKRLYIGLVAAMMLVAGASAQDANKKDLNKEITLEKDFVPVEKKATKKNTLPTVKKVTPPSPTTLRYSDWAEPTQVPSSIPTLLPYGYRTAHNFSDKRGYLQVGGGMAANFTGSAGYRLLDTEQNTLGVWLQHNSTWAGKNDSKLILNESERLKQKYNDNVLGVDFEHNNNVGTLTIGARGHFDSFNYYGGRDQTWDDQHKQTFTEAGLLAGWQGTPIMVRDKELGYHMNVGFNHASYDKAYPLLYLGSVEALKGAKENVLNIELGASYQLDAGLVGLDLTGDYVSVDRDANLSGFYGYLADEDAYSKSYFMLTLSPYYQWQNNVFRARAGADIVVGKMNLYDDDNRIHVSPRLELDIDIVDGAAIFVDISGGKTLNTLSSMAAQNRYSDPMGLHFNTFSPFDGRAGFKIGPFGGFSAQLYGGYGLFKGDVNSFHPSALVSPYNQENVQSYRVTEYYNIKSRGSYFGAELAYKYRSLVEAKATLQYAPESGDEVNLNKWYHCYPLDGLDGPNKIFSLDLRAFPIKPLAVELGLQYRGGRCYMEDDITPDDVTRLIYQDMDDALNLHAGASYRFDKVLTLWVKGNNLLNRKWDYMPGMGVQGFNLMGGVSLVF